MKNELNPVEKVYFTFYESKKKAMYFNEIREKADMSISSLQNALLKMEKLKEIIKTKEKANAFYSLENKEDKILQFMKFDIKKLNSLNIHVKIPINEFLAGASKISFILLFGSTSKGEEKKGSDIDILVVTHYFENKELNNIYQKEIKKQIESIKTKVNAKSIYPLSPIFINEKDYKDKKDYLLEEAKKTGFCIFGHETYYQENLA